MRNKLFIAAVAVVGMLAMSEAALPTNLQTPLNSLHAGSSIASYPATIAMSWFFNSDPASCMSDADALELATAHEGYAFALCPGTGGNYRVALKTAGNAAQILPDVSPTALPSFIGATYWAYQIQPITSSDLTWSQNVALLESQEWWGNSDAALNMAYAHPNVYFGYALGNNNPSLGIQAWIYDGASAISSETYNAAPYAWGRTVGLTYPPAIQAVSVAPYDPNLDPKTNPMSVTVTVDAAVGVDTPITLTAAAEGHALILACPAGATAAQCQTVNGAAYGVIPSGQTSATVNIASNNLPLKATGTLSVSVGASTTSSSGGVYYTGHDSVAAATASFTNAAGNNCENSQVPATADGTAEGCRMHCPIATPSTQTSDWANNGAFALTGLPWWEQVGTALEVSLRNPSAPAPIPFGTVSGSTVVKAFVAGTSEIVEIPSGAVFTASQAPRDASDRCQCINGFTCDASVAEGCVADGYCGIDPTSTGHELTGIELVASNSGDYNPAGGAANKVEIRATLAQGVDGPVDMFVTVAGWTLNTHYTLVGSCQAFTEDGTAGLKITIGANHVSGAVCELQATDSAIGVDVSVTATNAGATNSALNFAGDAASFSSNTVSYSKVQVTGLTFDTASPYTMDPANDNQLQLTLTLTKAYDFPVIVHVTNTENMMCAGNFDYEDFAVVSGHLGCENNGNTINKDMYITVHAQTAASPITIKYWRRAERTLRLDVTPEGSNGKNLNLIVSSSQASMEIRRPTVASVAFTDASQVDVSLSGTTQRTVRVTMENNAYASSVVLTFNGALAADVSGDGLAQPASCADMNACTSTVTLNFGAGVNSQDYVITFLASGNARTLSVTAVAGDNTNLRVVEAGGANTDSVTTAFASDAVIANDNDVIPATGAAYKNFRAVGTAGQPKTINVAAGASLRFEANANGDKTRIEHSTMVIPADATVTFADGGVEIAAGAKFNGKVVFEGAITIADVSGVNFEGSVEFAAGTSITTPAPSGRRLLACNSNPLFTNAAVTLGAGSQVSSAYVGTVTSWSSNGATLVAQAGYCADGSFIKLAAAGSDPAPGVVSVVGGTYTSADTANIIPLLSEFDSAYTLEVNINGVAITANGNTFDASHEGLINFAGANTRLIVESNTFNLGDYLNTVPIRVNSGASDVAIIAIKANTDDYSNTFSIKGNSLNAACRNYIMSDPELRKIEGQPRCSATVAINIAGASATIVQKISDKIIAQGTDESVVHRCDTLRAERVLNLLNLDLKGNERDVLIGADACSGACYSVCHDVEASEVDSIESYSQYVDLAVEFDTATSQLKHTLWANHPAGMSSRFHKINVAEWDDSTATDFTTNQCDSNLGASLPTADTNAGANFAAFTTAQTGGVTGGEWTRDAYASASRSFKLANGATTMVTGLSQYTGLLSLDEVKACSSTETEQFVGDSTSVQKKLTYFVWVYGIESSGSEDASGTVTYSTQSGGKTVMGKRHALQ